MTRLHTIDSNAATGELAETFAAVKRGIGRVPNAYATLGANSPALLAQLLQLNATLQARSALSKRQLEAINLAVSEASGCDYCVAAHTASGKAAGIGAAQARSLRSGSFPEDAQIDALIKFALLLVRTRGTLPPDALEAVRQTGITDRQIVETVGAISAILLTNMLNRVNDTRLDFPEPD